MAKSSIKTQQDLERHLRVYIDVLEDKGYDVDACVLKEAIVIINKHHYAVLPNACRAKKALLGALYASKKLLSVDDLMEASAKAHLVTDRRRLAQTLMHCKKKGEATNPVRGFWKIDKAGRDYMKRAMDKENKKKH